MIWLRKREINEKVKLYIINKSGTEEENKIHTEKLAKCSEGDLEAKKYVKNLIEEYLKKENYSYDQELIDEIYAYNWGLGILEKYDTPDVDEIIVLGTEILLKKNGKKIRVKEKFNDYEEVITIMRRCIEFNKEKDLNKANATKSSVRADGSRIQIVIPPVSEYPVLNIRKFGFAPTTENMLKDGTFTQKHVDILSTLVKGRANIIVIGDTESGKTTTLKWLVSFMDDDLIIGTLESEFEMYLKRLYPDKLIIPMQERENYPMNDLFPITLRQSVDLIIPGEVRKSYEAIEYTNAATRGHSGSMTSFHSLNARGAIDNLATLVMRSGTNIDFNSLKFIFAQAIDIVIKMKKLPKDKDGREKKICEGIYEIVENEENLTFEVVPIIELKYDEENPEESNEQIYLNSISEKLKHKLNVYGVKMSEINKVF